MTNDWMLDVLADLRQFADQNDMPGLARQLAMASAAARDEIRVKVAVLAEGATRDEGPGRTLPGRLIASQDA